MTDRIPAGGVRLVHRDPTLAGSTVVVPTFRGLGRRGKCALCQVTHVTKHYHLHLDAQAAVIVSHKILDELRKIGMAGFRVESQVKNPPPTVVGGGPSRRELRLMSKALEGIVPPGMNVTVTNGGGPRQGSK